MSGDRPSIDADTQTDHGMPNAQPDPGDPLLAYLSPAVQSPQHFRRRSFSFAMEYYTAIRQNHQRLIAMFNRLFPHPFSVTDAAMAEAGLTGERFRGGVVHRSGVEGRLVGRHPTTGAPVVAWNQQAFADMCASFDAENAARIVSWQVNSERLALSSERGAQHALWLDKALRTISLGTGLVISISVMGFLIFIEGAHLPMMVIGLFSSVFTGVLFGLPMLLLVGVPLFMLMRLGASIAGLGVGLWASRAHRTATVTDEAGQSSAAAILAAMQTDAAPAKERARQAERLS